MFALKAYWRVYDGLFELREQKACRISCCTKGVDNLRELLVVQVVSASVKLYLKRLPDGVASEVVLLQHENLREVDKRSGQELRHSLTHV